MCDKRFKPLPDGDFARVFADELTEVEQRQKSRFPTQITSANVVQQANADVQPYLAKICRRLLLDGSGLKGLEHLDALERLAIAGNSCLVALNHRSNLDVPTLFALLEDEGRADLFARMIGISGRKLLEDAGATWMLAQAFNRVIVSPRSWLSEEHTDEELHAAHLINIAAHRAIHELRHQGWIFALFPSATRMRPRDESSGRAIEETDSYLKNFEYLVLGRIDGCTLPVTRDHDLTHETPVLDRVRYTFGPVLRTAEWRQSAAERYPALDQRAASARAIMEDIAALEPGAA